jgi:diketogulonate reductase-like aldo/keto reductase
VIPKTATPVRTREDRQLHDFELGEADALMLARLETGERSVPIRTPRTEVRPPISGGLEDRRPDS